MRVKHSFRQTAPLRPASQAKASLLAMGTTEAFS